MLCVVLLFALFAIGACADSGPMTPEEIYRDDVRFKEVNEFAYYTKPPCSDEFEKFRKMVKDKYPYNDKETKQRDKDEWFRWDYHLATYFRAAKYDANVAMARFEEALEFRRKYKFDMLPDRDGTPGVNGKYLSRNDEVIKKFKANFDMEDRKGRAVAYLNVGAWPLKTALAKGEGDAYEAAMYRVMEGAVRAHHHMYMNRRTRWPRFYVLINFDGFKTSDGVDCADCTAMVTKIISTIWKIWPDKIDTIGLLNTTPEIEAFFNTVAKPLLPEDTQGRIYIYGTNQQEWLPKVQAMLMKHNYEDLTMLLKDAPNFCVKSYEYRMCWGD